MDTTLTKNSGFKRTSKREKLIIITFKNFRKTDRAPPRKTNPEPPNNERSPKSALAVSQKLRAHQELAGPSSPAGDSKHPAGLEAKNTGDERSPRRWEDRPTIRQAKVQRANFLGAAPPKYGRTSAREQKCPHLFSKKASGS